LAEGEGEDNGGSSRSGEGQAGARSFEWKSLKKFSGINEVISATLINSFEQ
jgi:hypothetical protein